LKPDGSGLQLLRSAVCATGDFSDPADLSRSLFEKLDRAGRIPQSRPILSTRFAG
jgi:hypothetical protein